MRNKFAGVLLLGLFSAAAFAAPKGKETIELKVVSSKTRIHGSSPDIFTYTSSLFTQVAGKNVLYECAQKGDLCPLMEAGKTYTVEREGNVIYISMNLPDEKRPLLVKYKEVGPW
jgi:hypothetical protein